MADLSAYREARAERARWEALVQAVEAAAEERWPDGMPWARVPAPRPALRLAAELEPEPEPELEAGAW